MMKLFQTEGRGWGLIADKDIMVIAKYKSYIIFIESLSIRAVNFANILYYYFI